MIKEDDFIRIGTVTGTHGLQGRMKIYIISDIAERFSPGNTVTVKEDNEFVSYTIAEFSARKSRIGLLKLDGITTIERASSLKGSDLLIEEAAAMKQREQLDGESYLFAEIIGCGVYRDGSAFGTVKDILQSGAVDVLILRGNDGKDYMIPFVAAMVDTSRLPEKRIDIYPIEGLFDI
ncbi:MAG: 16S rRNA processing protein RimM [Spirochaetes bacterium]|nr:16S rRNA processing protein RimM [Spirochaetota bacterium]